MKKSWLGERQDVISRCWFQELGRSSWLASEGQCYAIAESFTLDKIRSLSRVMDAQSACHMSLITLHHLSLHGFWLVIEVVSRSPADFTGSRCYIPTSMAPQQISATLGARWWWSIPPKYNQTLDGYMMDSMDYDSWGTMYALFTSVMLKILPLETTANKGTVPIFLEFSLVSIHTHPATIPKPLSFGRPVSLLFVSHISISFLLSGFPPVTPWPGSGWCTVTGWRTWRI